MNKKLFLRTAAFILAAVLLYPTTTNAISAQSAIVMDGKTGRVLYEKQADRQSLIASTTKIMTAWIVCQECNVLDIVTVPKEAVGIEGSSMNLAEGEELTVQDLLYGLMLLSGNDAAVALAIHCAGSLDAFVDRMNAQAQQLQLTNTHFANPHGLDARDHYSTARDLAILASHAMEDPVFAQTVSTKSITIGNRYLQNHNKLLWRLDGADGIKTGYTRAAGRILVSSASRDGRRLICVTINDGNDWADHKKLLTEGFAQFSTQKLVCRHQQVGTRCVLGGEKAEVALIAMDDFYYPVAPGEQISFLLPQRDFAFAPVVAGADAGCVYICIDQKPIGKVALEYGETIEIQTSEDPKLPKRWLGG